MEAGLYSLQALSLEFINVLLVRIHLLRIHVLAQKDRIDTHSWLAILVERNKLINCLGLLRNTAIANMSTWVYCKKMQLINTRLVVVQYCTNVFYLNIVAIPYGKVLF